MILTGNGRAARWAAAAGDLLLGSRCAGCGAPGLALCRACRTGLRRCRPEVAWPDPTPPGLPPPVAAGAYAGVLRGMILAHKEDQALLLTRALGRLLALALGLLLDLVVPAIRGAPAVVVVPVPSAPRVVRARGFDATAALARSAVRSLRQVRERHPGLRSGAVLRQRGRVRDQAGLSAPQRAANLQGALTIRAGWGRSPPAYAIVVDDVITSGASLAEASRALRAAGTTVLGAAVVAATRRRDRTGWDGWVD